MLSLEAAFLTDTGLVRPANEDQAWAHTTVLPDQSMVGLFIVCDGMGGHLGGEYASFWALEAIKQHLADIFSLRDPRATITLSKEDVQAVRAGRYITPKTASLEQRVNQAVQKANRVVYEYARHKPQTAGNAGTTIALAAIQENNMVLANVGDSRVYLLRDDRAYQLTTDHSYVAKLVSNRRITKEEMYTHPQRNLIYKYLGYKAVVEPDISRHTLHMGDSLVLCSDGLWEMLRSEQDILRIVKSSADAASACRRLVERANEAGGEDNISVVVVNAG